MSDLMIEATIQDVTQNFETGWFSVKTNRGKFDTKIREKADEALSLKGSDVRLFYVEGRASGNVNPHTGQPYPPPRYYDRADRIVSSNGGGGFTQDAPQRRGLDRDEVWRICLSVGIKASVATLPLMPSEQRTFPIQCEIATAWAKFLYFSSAPDLGASSPQQLASPPTPEEGFRPFGGQQRGAYDEPPDLREPQPGDIQY